MKRVFFTCLVALAFGVSDAYAQLPPTPKIYIGGGFSTPSGPDSFSEPYKTGPDAMAAIGLPLFPLTEAVLAVRYDRFGLDEEGLEDGSPGVSIDGGTMSVLSGSANLKINPPIPGPVSLYAIGGVGLYRSTTGDYTVSGGGGNLSVEGGSSTNLGVNIGAGVAFSVMPLLDLFVEPQYVIIMSDGEDLKYYPIRAGLAIGL